MADRIVVLDKGWISQVGTPLELYHKPANTFVAGFIGNPKMNFLAVTCQAADADGVLVSFQGGDSLRVPVDPANVTRGQSLTLGVRPEHLGIGHKGATVQAVPTVIERLGIHTVAHCSIAGNSATFCALLEGSAPVQVGEAIPLSFSAADCHLFSENGLALQRRIDMQALDPDLATAASA